MMRNLVLCLGLFLLAFSWYVSADKRTYRLSSIINRALTDGLTDEEILGVAHHAESKIKSEANGTASPYLLCAELTDDMYMRKLELEKIIQGEAHPVFVDVDNKDICYYLLSDITSSGFIPPSLQSFHYPPLLKIHSGVTELLRDLDSSVKPTTLLSFELFPSTVDSLQVLREVLSKASRKTAMEENREWFTGVENGWTKLRNDNINDGEGKCDFELFERLELGDPVAKRRRNIALGENAVRIRIVGIQNRSSEILSSPTALRSCLVALVESAARHPKVTRLMVGGDFQATNFAARGLTQTGKHSNEPFTQAKLLGQGQIVGVADTGLNDLSCFFFDDSNKYPSVVTTRGGTLEANRRKVIKYDLWAFSDELEEEGGHGTHVCGSLAGQCLNGEFDTDGMAPEAKIAFYDIGVTGADSLAVPSYTVLFGSAYSVGARVHSNSWGGGSNSQYEESDADLDSYTFNNKDFLVVVAAGNSGSEGRGSIGSPATAKNCLTVGSMSTRSEPNDLFLTQTTVSDFSSIGPTDDGRFGIDVVAPGDYIMSSMAGPIVELTNAISTGKGPMQSGVIPMSGTSMATPVVAGNAVLLRQYLTDLNYWAKLCSAPDSFCRAFNPSAAMLKAILINSCEPVDRYSDPSSNAGTVQDSIFLGAPPDVFQGFGAIRLSNVLPLASGEGLPSSRRLFLYDDLSLASGNIRTFTVSVANEAVGGTLKLTMVWTDPPSPVPVGLGSILVHDIDILVVDSSLRGVWGNNVPNGDRFNNVEQVTIANLQRGNYTVYVIARTVNSQPTQPVAIAMTYPYYSGQPAVSGPTPVNSLPTLTQTTTNAPSSVPAPAPAAPVPSVTSPFTHVTTSFSVVLGPTFTGLVKLFSIPKMRGELRFVSISLNRMSLIYAWAFAVVVQVGDGRTVQVGGENDFFLSTNRTYVRYWPSEWITRSEGDPKSRRDVSGAQLYTLDNRTWDVYAAFATSGTGVATTYTGTITLEIDENYDGVGDDDTYTAIPLSDTSDNSGTDTTKIIAIVVPLVIVFLIGSAVAFFCNLCTKNARGLNAQRTTTTELRGPVPAYPAVVQGNPMIVSSAMNTAAPVYAYNTPNGVVYSQTPPNGAVLAVNPIVMGQGTAQPFQPRPPVAGQI